MAGDGQELTGRDGPGAQQVPVEDLIGRESDGEGTWRRRGKALLAWRDWKLPVKLAAVTLVPVVLAVALGVSYVADTYEHSVRYERIDALVTLSARAGQVTNAVQRERAATATELGENSNASAELKSARNAVDAELGSLDTAIETAAEQAPDVSGAATNARRQLERLDSLRTDVREGRLDVVQSIEEYTAITEALLGLSGAATARVSDAEIGATPQALRELSAVQEEVGVQQAYLAYGADSGELTQLELNRVRTAEVRIEDRTANFRALATPDQRTLLDETVSAPSEAERQRQVRSVLGELGVSSDEAFAELSRSEWQGASGRVLDQLRQVSDGIAEDMVAASGELVSDARQEIMLLAALLAVALLLAGALVFVITRHLLRSLKRLRNGALNVAEKQLPEAVAAIQRGDGPDGPVEPVAPLSADEVGEVGKAFDAVHSQALKLAGEQAQMHTAYAGVFVNLSRRSQSLVQRQLQLIEQLERDEEDADQLAILFQLDHLATRMRRNNENLMMLSGSEGGRRSGRPVNTADVLRAAVGEIEQYQRVEVATPPTTKIVGRSAGDLVRLISELLDNATAFSPPESQVQVTSAVRANGSMVIEIIDDGIGLNAAEVAEANARMAEASSLAIVTSRRMGLFVVGRLARKNGVSVTLHGGDDADGVRARVLVPARLVVGAGGGPLTSELPAITEDMDTPPAGTSSEPELPTPRTAEHAESAAAVAATTDTDADAPHEENVSDAAVSDEPAAPAVPEDPARREGTPIFDEMLSAWFVAGDVAADADAEHEELSADRAWEFAVDENLRAARELAEKSEPDRRTDAGLPKRERGERLLPGSATADERSRSSVGRADRRVGDADEVRSRLSGFQHGVRRGKNAAAGGEERTGTDASANAGDTHSTAATDETHTAAAAEDASTAAPAAETNGTAAAGDTHTTAAGLPRRKRGEHLPTRGAAPKAPPSTPEATGAPERDPAAVRGRLNSFQSGLRRGGRGKAAVAAAAFKTESAHGDEASPETETEKVEGA